jgi:hypothetical protein
MTDVCSRGPRVPDVFETSNEIVDIGDSIFDIEIPNHP